MNTKSPRPLLKFIPVAAAVALLAAPEAGAYCKPQPAIGCYSTNSTGCNPGYANTWICNGTAANKPSYKPSYSTPSKPKASAQKKTTSKKVSKAAPKAKAPAIKAACQETYSPKQNVVGTKYRSFNTEWCDGDESLVARCDGFIVCKVITATQEPESSPSDAQKSAAKSVAGTTPSTADTTQEQQPQTADGLVPAKPDSLAKQAAPGTSGDTNAASGGSNENDGHGPLPSILTNNNNVGARVLGKAPDSSTASDGQQVPASFPPATQAPATGNTAPNGTVGAGTSSNTAPPAAPAPASNGYAQFKVGDRVDTYNPSANGGSATGGANASNGNANTNPKKAQKADRCRVSVGINQEYGCDSTETMVEGAKYSNIIAQAVGSATVQGVGMANANDAAKDGKMSSAVKAQAKSQDLAANVQLTQGAVNAALGAAQIYMASQHKKYQGNIGGAVSGADGSQVGVYKKNDQMGEVRATAGENSDTGRALKRYVQRREGKLEQANALREHAIETLQATGADAEGEQIAMRKEAMSGGILSMVTGVGQLIQGQFNKMAAREAKKAANNLNNAEKISVPTFNLNADEFAARAPTSITGNGTENSNAAIEEEDTTAPKELSLGDPLGNSFNGDPQAPGPAADPFKSASLPPSQNGGGGAPGGGSTSASGPGSEGESAARMAESSEKVQYQGAGSAGALGGGRGGAKGSDGPDLSKLFASLLPKSEDEKQTEKSILDFGGNRGPASESSILGRDSKSLFTRISEVNSDKFKRGYLR